MGDRATCCKCSACGWWTARRRRFKSCLLPAGSCSYCVQSPSSLHQHAENSPVAARDSPSHRREQAGAASPVPSISPPMEGHPSVSASSNPIQGHAVPALADSPASHPRELGVAPPVSSPSVQAQDRAVNAVPVASPDVVAALQQQVPDFTVGQLNNLIHDIEEELKRLDDGASSSNSQRFGKLLAKYEENQKFCGSFVDSIPKKLKDEVTENGRKLVLLLLTQVLGGMKEVKWIGVGFTFISWSLGSVHQTNENYKDCMDILRKSLHLLKDTKYIWDNTFYADAAPQEETLQRNLYQPIETAIRCAIYCTSNISEAWIKRYLLAPLLSQTP